MDQSTLLQQILTAAIDMGWLQWLVFILSISYVILAAKENSWCWPVGLVSVILYFFICIDPAVKLYSEATLQVFYMMMSIYGWWLWTRGTKQEAKESIAISRWSLKEHLLAIGGGILLLILLGYFWTWMGAALPYVDAFTTSFSIITTFMVTRKILENWIYWIVIDLVSIFIYWDRELYLLSLLFGIYCVVAIFGYIEWKKKAQLPQLL